MTANVTLLVQPEDLELGELEIEGDAYRHLVRARRMGIGDAVRLVDGAGRARWSRLVTIGAQRARLRLGDPAPPNESRRQVQLVVASLRRERASWLVEKATEVGVRAIRFVNAERAPREFGRSALDRLSRVAAAATEQCHRSRVPEITGTHEWQELPELLAGSVARWLLDPRAPAVTPVAGGGPLSILIGPEGGWTDAETSRLRALGCQCIGLGPRVLRIETAALVGAALALLPDRTTV